MKKKGTILSGIQPTGNFHVGSYLGAVKNWVHLQNSGDYEMYIFIPDLHALTGNRTAPELREQRQIAVAELLAAGLDPKRTTLFFQSDVRAHAELAWVFSCITPIAELERMTQYKDKSADQKHNINAGLFTYPVLQAADILLYHGTVVPVGQDQVQHVELTRDIARWFNRKYGDYFREPEALLTEVPKVMSLLEPTKKMSKSKGEGHVIELADSPDVIEKKLKRAITASEGGSEAPGARNLIDLLKHFDAETLYEQYDRAEQDGNIRYGELKGDLARVIADYFTEFRARRAEYLADRSEIDAIMVDGAARAGDRASNTIRDVYERVGLR